MQDMQQLSIASANLQLELALYRSGTFHLA